MLLHRIFQRHHIRPDELYAMEWRKRAFIYASEELMIEAEQKAKRSQGGR